MCYTDKILICSQITLAQCINSYIMLYTQLQVSSHVSLLHQLSLLNMCLLYWRRQCTAGGVRCHNKVATCSTTIRNLEYHVSNQTHAMTILTEHQLFTHNKPLESQYRCFGYFCQKMKSGEVSYLFIPLHTSSIWWYQQYLSISP